MPWGPDPLTTLQICFFWRSWLIVGFMRDTRHPNQKLGKNRKHAIKRSFIFFANLEYKYTCRRMNGGSMKVMLAKLTLRVQYHSGG